MMKCRVTKIVNVLMLALYLGYFAGTTLFIHHHHVRNHVIVHSHPHAGHSHGHTAKQLQLLDILQNRTSTEAVSFGMPPVAQIQLHVPANVELLQPVIIGDPAVPRLRAPPVC